MCWSWILITSRSLVWLCSNPFGLRTKSDLFYQVTQCLLMAGGSPWVHCASSRRSPRKSSARLRRRIFRGRGSTTWILTRSVSWSGCQRVARQSISIFTSCRSWNCLSMCSQSQGRRCEWNWPLRQTSSGMTKYTANRRLDIFAVSFCLHEFTCGDVTMFHRNFQRCLFTSSNLATLQQISNSCRHESFRITRQWLLDTSGIIDSCSACVPPHNAHFTAKINKVKDLSLIFLISVFTSIKTSSSVKTSWASIFLHNFLTHPFNVRRLSSMVNLIAVTTLWRPVYIAANKE